MILPLKNCVDTIPSFSHPGVDDWADRVITNGGEKPSFNTIYTLYKFYRGLDFFGLTPLMVSVNCFVPDNLTASITPLIKVAGNDPWTNGSGFAGSKFVAGDLTVDGLKGNGIAKFLNTGVIAATSYNSENIGITAYAMSISGTFTTGRHDIGALENNFTTHRLSMPYSTTQVQFCCWGGGESGGGYFNSNALSGSRGYYSGNRTSDTYFALYQANSFTTHSVGGFVSASSYGNPPNISYFVFGKQDSFYGSAYSDKRLSFVAFHYGLSLAQSSNFFNLVQAMRVGLGGGYV